MLVHLWGMTTFVGFWLSEYVSEIWVFVTKLRSSHHQNCCMSLYFLNIISTTKKFSLIFNSYIRGTHLSILQTMCYPQQPLIWADVSVFFNRHLLLAEVCEVGYNCNYFISHDHNVVINRWWFKSTSNNYYKIINVSVWILLAFYRLWRCRCDCKFIHIKVIKYYGKPYGRFW